MQWEELLIAERFETGSGYGRKEQIPYPCQQPDRKSYEVWRKDIMRKSYLKRIVSTAMAALLITANFTGCGSDTTTESDTGKAAEVSQESADSNEIDFDKEGLNEAETIRLAYMPGSYLYEVNKKLHYVEDAFEAYGVEVEFTEFTYGPPIIESIASGDIDVAFGIGTLPGFTGVSNGTNLKIVYTCPSTEKGAQALVVKKDSEIETVDDLVGKIIGVPVGSSAQLYLSELLDSGGYSVDDITLVNIAAADMATSLANGDVDAGVLWETVLSKAISSIDGKGILYSKELEPDQTLIDVESSFAEKNPKLVAVLISAAIRINDYILEHEDETAQIMADATGDSKEAYTSLYNMTKQEGFTQENYDYATRVKQFLEDNDLLQNDFDEQALLTNVYWEKAKELIEEENK